MSHSNKWNLIMHSPLLTMCPALSNAQMFAIDFMQLFNQIELIDHPCRWSIVVHGMPTTTNILAS